MFDTSKNKRSSDSRYRDNYGRIEWISEMTMQEIAHEINERLSLLEDAGQSITDPDIDPRVIDVLGTKYIVNQVMFVQSTPKRSKHFSAILISIPYAETIALNFDSTYTTVSREWTSFAHEFLKTLRNMCDNLELVTASEQRYIQNSQLDHMYQTYAD